MKKHHPQSAKSPILMITSHVEKEPAFANLCKCGFSFLRFQEKLKKWDDPGNQPAVYILEEAFLPQDFTGLLELFFHAPVNRPVVVLGKEESRGYLAGIFPDRLFEYLPNPVESEGLLKAIQRCVSESERRQLVGEFEKKLVAAQKEIDDLLEIGVALSAEKDSSRLLELILTRSRNLVGADAASIYLREGEGALLFCLTQNSSLDWQLRENSLIPMDETSIAGYVASSAKSLNLLDAYLIDSQYPFSFNRSFDENSGFRSKSMVVVPIKNATGDVLGVVQIINKRSDFHHHRPGKKLQEEAIVPFSLLDISKKQYCNKEGEIIPFLGEREAHVLAVRKGSLSEQERKEIEAHVIHTFNFLSKIPWIRSFRRIPEIALSHHEKLNGRGYPNHLEASQIPLESKLMTISDIYDALTAKDRPYKRSIPKARAFDIMYNEVKQGLLSQTLLDIFIEARIHEVIDTRF